MRSETRDTYYVNNDHMNVTKVYEEYMRVNWEQAVNTKSAQR